MGRGERFHASCVDRPAFALTAPGPSEHSHQRKLTKRPFGEVEAVPADWPASTGLSLHPGVAAAPSCLDVSAGPSFPHHHAFCICTVVTSLPLEPGRTSELCNLKLRVNEMQGQGPSHLPPTPQAVPCLHFRMARFSDKFCTF